MLNENQKKAIQILRARKADKMIAGKVAILWSKVNYLLQGYKSSDSEELCGLLAQLLEITEEKK